MAAGQGDKPVTSRMRGYRRRLISVPGVSNSFISMGKHVDRSMHRLFCTILVALPSAADQNRIRRRKNSDPLRQIGCRFQKLLLFPEECATVRQLQLAGGGGWRR